MNDDPQPHGGTGPDRSGAASESASGAPRTSEGLTDWTIPAVPSVEVDPADWEWARRPAETPTPDLRAQEVGVVLVVHEAEDWLARTLVGLARLSSRPGTTIAVDTGSADGSPRLLEQARGEGLLDEVLTLDADATPARAVDAAIAEMDPCLTHLWILHDDVEVTPSALDNLLVEASRAPHADVLVPTLLKPARRNYPELIDELGQTIDHHGDRVLPLVDEGDIDQHQGEPTAVLGGSTAGMMVRRQAWERLGGPDPAVPLFRDGVELGWRANEAGLVVRTAPTCTIHHRQVGRAWQRDSELSPRPDVTDRLAGMRIVAARSSHPTARSLALAGRCLLVALVLLVGKAPGRAADAWRAGWQLWRTRETTAQMAQRLTEFHQGCDPDDMARAARLLPTRRGAWARLLDRTAAGVSDRLHPDRPDDPGTSLDDLTGEDHDGRDHRAVVNPYTVMTVGMVLVALVAGRHLYGTGRVTSAWLAPSPRSLGQAWAQWFSATPGLAGGSAPWQGLAALGSTLSLGQPEVFARLCLGLGPVVAALSAHRLLRRVVGLGAVAVLLSSVWGLLPVVTGGVARGSVTALALAVIAPHLALHCWRLVAPGTVDVTGLWGATVRGHRADPWRDAGAAALWATLAMSFVPVVWVLVAVAMVTTLVVRREVRAQAVVVLVAPVLVLWPWWVRLWATPGRLLTGADPLLRSAEPMRAGPWALVGGIVPTAAAPAWVGVVCLAPLWLAAGWALTWLLRDRAEAGRRRGEDAARGGRARVVVCTTTGLASFVAAGLGGRVLVTVWGRQTHPTVELWQLAGLGVLLVLVALAWQGTRLRARAEEEAGQAATRDRDGDEADDSAPSTPSVAELIVAWSSRVLPVALGISVAAGALWWLVGGAGSPLHRDSTVLPAYVTAVENSSRSTRTLVVEVRDGATRWNLVDAATPTWGSGEQPLVSPDPGLRRPAAGLARAVSTGSVPDNLADRLAGLGIGHVWLRGATPETIAQVGNAPGLTAAVADSGTTVWTVEGQPSLSLVVTGDRSTPVAGQVPAGPDDRVLRLLEPEDPRRRVTVAGQPLTALGDTAGSASDGAGAPTFGSDYRLGARSGHLEWSMPHQWWALLVELGGVLVLLVMAGPTATRRGAPPRRAVRARTRGDRRRSRRRSGGDDPPVGRGDAAPATDAHRGATGPHHEAREGR